MEPLQNKKWENSAEEGLDPPHALINSEEEEVMIDLLSLTDNYYPFTNSNQISLKSMVINFQSIMAK